MNIVKKRIVVTLHLILPFFVVSNRMQGMGKALDLVRKNAFDTLAKGGVGVLFGAVGGYLLGSQGENPNDWDMVELREENVQLKNSQKKHREETLRYRQWKNKLLRELGLSMNTREIPKKIIFAINLYEMMKSELCVYQRDEQVLERASVEQIFLLHKEEVIYPLKEKLDKANKDKKKITLEVSRLKAELDQLKAEPSQLKAEPSQLKKELSQLNKDKENLVADIEQLRAELLAKEDKKKGSPSKKKKMKRWRSFLGKKGDKSKK